MTFNGNDLIAFCGGGVSINKEIPPSTLGRTITGIGGAGGHILGNVENAPKTYTARINLHGHSMAEAWALKLRLAEWAYTDGLADLIPTHDPSRRYRAICQSISDPEFIWGACTVDVVFYIPDPYMLAVELRTVGGTSNEATWINRGTADPLITVTVVPSASYAYPTIYLNDTQIFMLNSTVGANVPIVVDFGQKYVSVNGASALTDINYLYTNWHPAFASENTIESEASTVSVEVVDRWL